MNLPFIDQWARFNRDYLTRPQDRWRVFKNVLKFLVTIALIIAVGFLLLSLHGCAGPTVDVVRVDKDQLRGCPAVRLGPWPDGSWSVYLARTAGSEVLEWEIASIRNGRTDDPYISGRK